MKLAIIFLALLCGAVAGETAAVKGRLPEGLSDMAVLRPTPADGQIAVWTGMQYEWRSPTLNDCYKWSPELQAEAADVVKAMKLLLKCAEAPFIVTIDAVYRTPAAQLRKQADDTEQREKDIAWARSVLAKWEQRAK